MIRYQKIFVVSNVLSLSFASPNSINPNTHHMHVYTQLSEQGESCTIMCIDAQLTLSSHLVYISSAPTMLSSQWLFQITTVSVDDPAIIPTTHPFTYRHKIFLRK